MTPNETRQMPVTNKPAHALASRNAKLEFSSDLCAIVLAIALTLVVRGYQFGRSNHTVYLLDALRVNDPTLLANDWYTTHTLQYHFVFTHITAAFDRAGILQPAFLIGYLAIIIFFQLAWFLINRTFGGSRKTYLLSNILYLVSAGGAGLGVFDFLQDSAFVPSNISNVAMLWGVYFWITRRPARAGLLLGMAGFFHLNHALVAIALWMALIMWDVLIPARLGFWGGSRSPEQGSQSSKLRFRSMLFGTGAVLLLCLPNLIPAARASLSGPHKIPLKDFVDLYVHLRHPHHYDPLSWPLVLWISFLWPFPLAIIAARQQQPSVAIREASRIALLICAMMAVAFVFAGVWFISEPLVQASLFRFSIYPKLLTCIGAAIFFTGHSRRPALTYACALCAVVIALVLWGWRPAPALVTGNYPTLARLLMMCLFLPLFELADGSNRYFASAPRLSVITQWFWAISMSVIVTEAWLHGTLGLSVLLGADITPDYRAVCDFARTNTPSDAIFLVPPDEQEFRLVARRAIVINFKGVAQLSSELGEWRDRLCHILDVPSLDVLPHRFDLVFDDLARRYAALPPEHLSTVAGQYNARYVVASRIEDFAVPNRLVFTSGIYHLYDLRPESPASRPKVKD
jgi:hypothetical protein